MLEGILAQASRPPGIGSGHGQSCADLSLILTMAAVSTCAAKAFLIVKRTGVHVTV